MSSSHFVVRLPSSHPSEFFSGIHRLIRIKVSGKANATVPHTIRVRKTPFGPFDVFVDHCLEHPSIKAVWLSLVLADNGISNYKYRDLMRRVNEFGEATETSTEKPPYSLRKLLFI